MKIKLDRIISIATLTTSVIALALVLKRPQPVAPTMPAASVAANARSFNDKLSQFQQGQAQGDPGGELRLNAQEVRAAIAQAAGAISPAGNSESSPASSAATAPAAGSAGDRKSVV